jgi:hypothetical protein
MAQATFGLFDWIDRSKAPLYQLYEERLQPLQPPYPPPRTSRCCTRFACSQRR